jgi:hypothetical protein
MSFKRSGIFPTFAQPKSLHVLDIRPYTWDEQLTATCLQGLINRTEPRIYLVFDDYVDRLWLSIYKDRYGIEYNEVDDLYELISNFARELNGYVIYDKEMLHSANVAMTYGSIRNAIAASDTVAEKLSKTGLENVEDFRGMWKNRVEAYEWALQNLIQGCSKTVVGSCCVDGPYLRPNNKLNHIRDYLVASKAFTFDLSTKIRDRDECKLFDKILSHFTSLGAILGWHCSKAWESEYVARAAKNGFFVLCNLRSPNLTVHAGIKTDFKFEQKHVSKHSLDVENKVYVSFIHSDGDAMWALNNFYAKNWLDSQRGKFPLTWETQPYALDLAPGQLEHYYRTASSNDYFVGGPSGAGYTAPTLNKRLDEFLENTRNYFQLCDLRSALIMDRDPREYFEEIENPRIAEHFITKVNNCLGFVHGYLGSVFGISRFVGYVPYLHTTLYVDGTSDVLHDISSLGRTCKTRPLFIVVHVRENTEMSTLSGAINKLDPREYKVVKLDELLLALQKAIQKGQASEKFPEAEHLTENVKRWGLVWWQNNYIRMLRLESVIDLNDDQVLREFNSAGFDFEREQLADVITYEVVETLLHLMRAALNRKGIHANSIKRAVKYFLKEFEDLPDVELIVEAYEMWRNWENVKNDPTTARSLAKRAITLAKAINARLLM